MNEPNQKPDGPDLLEQAIDAVRSRPMPAGPPAHLLASTEEAIQNRLAVMKTAAKPRESTTRFIRYGSFAAAAAIVVWVFVALLGLNNGTARAFGQALEKLQLTETVRYRAHTESEFPGPAGTLPIRASHLDEVTIRGKRMRVESVAFPKLIWIIDSEISGLLILDPQTKTYQTVDLAAKTGAIVPFDIMAVNMRAQLENLIRQIPVFEKTETVDGVATERYAINGGESLGLKGDWTIWLDRKSSDPVRIVFESMQEGKSLRREYSHFEWNPTIADSALSLEPPDGYREHTIFRTIPPLVSLPKQK